MIYDIIHLGLGRDRLFDLTHRSHRKAQSSGYRFGRLSPNTLRLLARYARDLAGKSFAAALRMITAAKLRRIAREFRIHGPQHDWMRIGDDHFTPIDR